jgi:hypothetical protein
MMVTWSHHEIRSTEPRDDRNTGARLKGSAKALDIWRLETKIEALFCHTVGFVGGQLSQLMILAYGCTKKSPHRTRMSLIVDLIGFNGI